MYDVYDKKYGFSEVQKAPLQTARSSSQKATRSEPCVLPLISGDAELIQPPGDP